MYFKTSRITETGKTMVEFIEKVDLARAQNKAIGDEHDFTQYRPKFGCLAGGFSSVIFDKETVVDTAVWKNVNDGEWMPKKSSKKGKVIYDAMQACTTIDMDELNAIVSVDPFNSNIGYRVGKKEFGFEVPKDWIEKKTFPKDLIEVTETEYENLEK